MEPRKRRMQGANVIVTVEIKKRVKVYGVGFNEDQIRQDAIMKAKKIDIKTFIPVKIEDPDWEGNVDRRSMKSIKNTEVKK